LFGRLLAIAESIESKALEIAEEKRETAASRYMQAFADRPFETWLIIAKGLKPYEARLRANPKPWCAKFLAYRQDLIAKVGDLFDPDDFTSKRTRLDSEFLLGYYCQHVALRSKRSRLAAGKSTDEDNINDKFDDQD
jgi:CRISPR-associated protein Csd1